MITTAPSSGLGYASQKEGKKMKEKERKTHTQITQITPPN